ncbi:MAG: serine/threonine-protein kinase [Victivallaceae bacterium]|nr:serine/threonine-protein kinase [Victivallaceae bacterium]MDD3702812.1 serine/threonine-protein kinase [Victivallaceae bacterium]MDD4317757.1 serine/threonine-protein kinase [Victivallaceae bacterium]MDD5663331.1 serine/threonine-protein kinase [Victivallaceae bacterium]NLK83078.1 serine/threonine protein kinase [Lentisphaerota bacterium]
MAMMTDELDTLKISCFQCEQRLDLSNMEPFSKIECPNCGTILTVPMWFNSYLLEDICNSNRVSTTYRAVDITLDREVAIKVLAPEIAADRDFCAIFLRAGRATARINHPGIVSTYMCKEFDQQPYLVMQYMALGSIEKKLSEPSPAPQQDALKWMEQITCALEYAFSAGITHGEVTPQNIMLDAQNDARIGAFGMNRALTIAGLDCGTPAQYLSTELNEESNNCRPDIYSLGAVMYELFTGWRLSVGTPPKDVRAMRKIIPEILAGMISRMLSESPDDRPTYKTIIETLKKCRNSEFRGGGLWKKIFPFK